MDLLGLIKKFYHKKYDEVIRLIEQDVEFPKLAAQKIIQRKLRHIPNYYIIRHTGMQKISLAVYLLWLKYGGNIQTIPIENDMVIKIGRLNVTRISYLTPYIHFISIEHGMLKIEGMISYPIILETTHEFYIEVNGMKNRIILNDEMKDIGDTRERSLYESSTTFQFKYKLNEPIQIQFVHEVDGIRCPCGKINFMRFSPVADYIKHQYCLLQGWMGHVDGNKLCFYKADSAEIFKRERLFQESLVVYNPSKAKWAIRLRNQYFSDLENKVKPIWLFMDRPESADDNAKVLFCYIQKYKNIDSFFIISKDSKDYAELKKHGNVIALYSEEHYRLTFLADYMISSQANGVVENPFWEDAEMFRDLYHQPKLIFLQHGVIKDDMSPTLYRFHTNFTGFITSTVKEWKSILDYPYDYTAKEVWLTGLPRFDRLYNDAQKYILVMPSWRKEIMQHIWDAAKHNMVWQAADDFKESLYFKSYYLLLRDSKLIKKCQEYGYKFVFIPHPLMRDYGNQFTDGSICELWEGDTDYQKAFAIGCMLITDYSSVAFDFAFLEKPVLYYQFDKEVFFGNHTYRKGYFDYEKDGFGEVCNSHEALVDLICEYMENGMSLKTVYQQRMQQAFLYHDKNNCERIYRLLTKRKDGIKQ